MQTLDWQSGVQPFGKKSNSQNRNGAVNLFAQELQTQQEKMRLENEQKPQSEQVTRLMHQIQVNRAIQQLASMQTEKLQQTQLPQKTKIQFAQMPSPESITAKNEGPTGIQIKNYSNVSPATMPNTSLVLGQSAIEKSELQNKIRKKTQTNRTLRPTLPNDVAAPLLNQADKDIAARAAIEAEYERDLQKAQEQYIAKMPKSKSLLDTAEAALWNATHTKSNDFDSEPEVESVEERWKSYKLQQARTNATVTWQNRQRNKLNRFPEEDQKLLHDWSWADLNIRDVNERAAKKYLYKYQLKEKGYDEKELEDLVRYLNAQSNAELAEQEEVKNRGYADRFPMVASVETLLDKPAGGVLSTADYAVQAFDRFLNGSKAPIDTNTTLQNVSKRANDIRSQVSGNLEDYSYFTPEDSEKWNWLIGDAEAANKFIGKGMSTVYQGGMGALDTAAASILPGPLGSMTLGAEAGSQAMTYALEQGASNEQALLYALSSGIAEQYLSSKLSLGNLKEMQADAVVHDLREVAKNTAKTMGVDVTDALVGEATDLVNQALILQNKSELSRAWDENYVMADQLGLSEQAAKDFANRETTKQVMSKLQEAGINGFVSGAIHSGQVNAYGIRNAKRIENFQNALAGENLREYQKLTDSEKLNEANLGKQLGEEASGVTNVQKLLKNHPDQENAFNRIVAAYYDQKGLSNAEPFVPNEIPDDVKNEGLHFARQPNDFEAMLLGKELEQKAKNAGKKLFYLDENSIISKTDNNGNLYLNKNLNVEEMQNEFSDWWENSKIGAKPRTSKASLSEYANNWLKWKRRGTIDQKTQREYQKWLSSIRAESSNLDSLEKYYEGEYTNSKEYRLLSEYSRSVEEGWISPMVGLDLYTEYDYKLGANLAGKIAANNKVVKGRSSHFMDRVFGTTIDPQKYRDDHAIIRRSGVKIEDVLDCILKGKPGEIDYRDGEPGQKIISDRCKIVINPETGMLIQCNLKKSSKEDTK